MCLQCGPYGGTETVLSDRGSGSASEMFAEGKGGTLLLIVGPSGAGKDTVISGLRQRYDKDPRVLFVQRWITRQPDEKSEAHVGLSPERFESLQADGRFAATWCAHGLHYGLPMEALEHVRNGGIAIANGSRRALDAITKAFQSVEVVNLTIDPLVLEKRLMARGRETPEAIRHRLKDAANYQLADGVACRSIDNSGDVETTINQVVSVIEGLPRSAQIPLASQIA